MGNKSLFEVMAGSMIRNLTYHPRLYLGDSISGKKLDKIKRRLHTKPLLANVFLITIASNPRDQLDILDARQIAQPYYRGVQLDVVGIASDHEEAVVLVEQIVKECLRERGDCALKEYLLC